MESLSPFLWGSFIPYSMLVYPGARRITPYTYKWNAQPLEVGIVETCVSASWRSRHAPQPLSCAYNPLRQVYAAAAHGPPVLLRRVPSRHRYSVFVARAKLNSNVAASTHWLSRNQALKLPARITNDIGRLAG